MKWSSKSLKDLNDIVTYLKKNQIGSILEPLGKYFIRNYENKIDIDNYVMNFSSDSPIISDGEYKLAIICEMINSNHSYLNVYSCFSFMIKYCIEKKFKIIEDKIDYDGFYLLSLLKEKLLPDILSKGKDDPIYRKLNISVLLVKEFIKKNYQIPISSLAQCEILDLSILNFSVKKAFYEILKTKKTSYIRLLLILTYEISKIDIQDSWLSKKILFDNYSDFLSVINSPLIESIIFLTSKMI